MEHRKILIKMREQRQQELEYYSSIYSKIETSFQDYPDNLINKRQALLTLELPFKTDPISVNQALTKPQYKWGTTLEDWDAHDLPMSVDAYLETKYKRASFINFLQSIGPKVNVINYSSIKKENSKLCDISFKDFIHQAPCFSRCCN